MRKPSCLVFSDAAHIISEQVHLESIGSLKMKVSVVLQCVFLVGFLSTLEGRARGRARAATSKWRDCTDPNSPMKVTRLEISPNPVSLPGEILFSLEGYSNRTIGSTSLQFHIIRKLRSMWLESFTIPCMFNIGSCTYPNMCTMLDEMRTGNWAGITTQLSNDIDNMLRENNINPTLCPQPPQQMNIVEHRLQMPAMPSILSFFADGTYVAHVTVTDNASGEELQCFDLEMDVRLVEEPECTGWFCMFG